MADLCDLQVHINGQQTFYIHEKTISRFSSKLRKLIKKEKKRTQIRKTGIEIHDFPGGSDGFELFSRFCYNNGEINITVSNVSLLHCFAVFLSMNDTLVPKTTDLFNHISDWSFTDVRDCLKSCTPFITYADSFGIIDKLISNLIIKITQHSDSNNLLNPSSSSSSSPDSTGKSGFGLSRECRGGLERLIGGVLDQAKVDDLLVSNNNIGSSGVYDVNLVLRLIRESNKVEGVCLERMKKVGGLVDKYLGEIAPDQNLKISKFLGVAESLPDCARDCFDGVYKAIDIYLEKHAKT
ncbi:hypothetical protein M8C21_004580 [Ambrosia artemisiifolia]|uniref:BTB domain-containing protein n=1 Tax=Ambrosia artemisiifolia TaxID=4212 RepID=A0AAD5BLX3_AMBAR|nr:hypothetical protein M8C21_004580 [Ambrosia artemisiifolia]